MYSVELILTVVILLVAVAWAARKLYRWTRRSSSRTEVSGCVADCQTQHDACGHCPVVKLVPDRPATKDDD
jgi:hypothetical protein